MSYKTSKLYNTADWINGSAFKASDFTNSGLPVIKIAELKQGISSQTKLTDKTFDEKYKLNNGDLLFSWSGSPDTSIDIFQYTMGPAWLNQHIFKVIEHSDEFENEYFYYLLKNKLPLLIAIAKNKQTTGLGHVTVQDLKRIDVSYLESNTEQRQVAKVLGDLDRKIELNRRMNVTLEQIGQTLFKHYFIDKPERETWNNKTLNDFIDLSGGLSYKASAISEVGTAMVTMGCVSPNGRFKTSALKHYSGDYNDRHRLKPGDLVIATRDVTQDRILIGAPALIPSYIGDEIIAATNLYMVHNKGLVSNLLLYRLLSTKMYREQIIANAKGSTIVMITRDSVLGYSFPFPDDNEVLIEYEKQESAISSLIEGNSKQIQSLQSIRDSLLPKLMSGEITV